uniref:Superoxide dismutase copper/zinc binding domain-containing protein n=1 Tax=Eptatretus burgeri TaxID=7764 RepID=A0A8C4NBM7_EPTBU
MFFHPKKATCIYHDKRDPPIGTILCFRGDPYADVSIFIELAHANNTTPLTSNHNWHVHTWPIQSASDLQPNRCASVGGHFNPYDVPVSETYTSECQKDNTFMCEAGDFSGKHGQLDIPDDLALVSAKHFFTDTTVSLLGPHTIVNRSVVVHASNDCSLVTASASPMLCIGHGA